MPTNPEIIWSEGLSNSSANRNKTGEELKAEGNEESTNLDICKTILKSGKFNEESLRELTEYINKHPSKNAQWPQKILIEPLQLAWNDGIIDHDELKKLRKLVISITAGSINDDEIQSLTEPLLNDKDREEEIDNRIMRRWGENGRSLLYNRGLSQHDYNIFVQDCSDTPNPKKSVLNVKDTL